MSDDGDGAPDREGPASNPARPHACRRCGATIGPGHVYGALDLLDADGELRVLLCRSCSADLRHFLDGHPADGGDDPHAGGA
jgi:hypothetical protein